MEDESTSEKKQFRHRLIQEEFRSILGSPEYKVPVDTQGVVALSAPPVKDENGTVIDEASPENKERIGFSVEVIRQIVAQKLGKNAGEITDNDILNNAPPLILNGETEQLLAMAEIAQKLGFPGEKIELIDCGKRGIGNTQTQFEAINNDPRFENFINLTFVSSDYHVPRVIRTGDKNLRSQIHFDVLPVPHDRISYNVFRVVRGEVRRIEKYSENGDIARTPIPR